MLGVELNIDSVSSYFAHMSDVFDLPGCASFCLKDFLIWILRGNGRESFEQANEMRCCFGVVDSLHMYQTL